MKCTVIIIVEYLLGESFFFFICYIVSTEYITKIK